MCKTRLAWMDASHTLESEARFLEKKTMEFTPAARSRAYRHIVDQVCDAIVGGDIQVGDMLPTERDMAAQSGISRTSVREAMKVLEECGLVERTAGAGGGTTIISDIIPVELLGKAIGLSRQRIMYMLEVRQVLETTSAELAAARADAHQLAVLERLLEIAQQLPEGDLEYTERFPGIDHKFHLALAKATHNEVLFELIRKLRKEVAVAVDMIPWMEQNRTLGLSTMALIVEGVKQRNPVDARTGMLLHLTYLPGVVERVFQH